MPIDERKPTVNVCGPHAAQEAARVFPSAELATDGAATALHVPTKRLLDLMVDGETPEQWERVMAEVNEKATRHRLAAPGPVNLIFDSVPTMVASVTNNWDAVEEFAATVKRKLDATVEELQATEWWKQLPLPADCASALEHVKQLVENRIRINLDGGDEESRPARLGSTEKGGFTRLMDTMGEYRRIFSDKGLALPKRAYLFGAAAAAAAEIAQFQAELASIKKGAAAADTAAAAKIAQLQAELASIKDRAAAAQAAAAAEIAQLQAHGARAEVAMVGLVGYFGSAVLPSRKTRERRFRDAKEISDGTREYFSGETGSGCVSGWTPRLGQGAASRVADECMQEYKREQTSVDLSSSLVTAPGAVEP